MKKIKILIRIDDLCPTMNKEMWEITQKMIDSKNVKPLIGVIPNCKDPDLMCDNPDITFWKKIKTLYDNGYTIAMHGYEHICNTNKRGIATIRRWSEFAGLSYAEQKNKIEQGKKILNSHGIFTDVFFAPSHSYDKNTLRALYSCGFKYISDGKTNKPIKRCGIICIPCKYPGTPVFKKRGYFTAVFHPHEWVKKDKQNGFSSLKTILNDKREYIVDFASYKNQKNGFLLLEVIYEKIFILWNNIIKEKLSMLIRGKKS